MKDDKHNKAIPAELLEQARGKISEARALLAPYMLALTAAERHDMLKMGEKSLAFVEKAYDFAKQNPALVPPYLDMDAFGVDFEDAHGLWTIHSQAVQLTEGLSDTGMTAGSEAFQAALVFYNSVKAAALSDVPGAKALYEELKHRFPGGKRRNDTAQTEG